MLIERVCRTKGAISRREVIISYSKHDNLELHKPVSQVLDRILGKPLNKVKEFTARFINALSSDYMGRAYLLESGKLVLLLITVLKKEVISYKNSI